MALELTTFTTTGTSDVIPLDFGGRGGTFVMQITDAGGAPAATAEIRSSPDGGTTWGGVFGTNVPVSGAYQFTLDTYLGFKYRLWYPTAARTVKIYAQLQ